ncbi:MAG: glycosyltransferase family 2 protein [Verrucomicrobiota bacterium]
MKFSIIVPFYNEEGNVVAVLDEIKNAQPDAEIIAVNDGSTDGTSEILQKQSGTRLINHPRNLGQSAALYSGLMASSGDICVMMDGDGQNDPADIGKLVEALAHADVACGYRAKRQDSWSKKIASRIANNIRSAILRDGIRDTGCTLKAMRREHVQYLVPFNGLHRFIPALLRAAGLSIIEVPVNHRPRRAGISKYTIGGRALRGIFDLIGVYWLLKRRIRW